MLHSPIILGRTGYRPSFRAEEINRCPGCGGNHWYVGRITAECAFCGSALPIAVTGAREGLTARAA
ncbi:MAG: hypothetical protein A4S16_02490 [Proteobacteria bacterium SG_bin6]|nr:MAG: hypothetical protein A4S16_02490 [Proteobacteria bacterium SG_bin6]